MKIIKSLVQITAIVTLITTCPYAQEIPKVYQVVGETPEYSFDVIGYLELINSEAEMVNVPGGAILEGDTIEPLDCLIAKDEVTYVRSYIETKYINKPLEYSSYSNNRESKDEKKGSLCHDFIDKLNEYGTSNSHLVGFNHRGSSLVELFRGNKINDHVRGVYLQQTYEVAVWYVNNTSDEAEKLHRYNTYLAPFLEKI